MYEIEICVYKVLKFCRSVKWVKIFKQSFKNILHENNPTLKRKYLNNFTLVDTDAMVLK